MRLLILLATLLVCGLSAYSQTPKVVKPFPDSRIVNAHSGQTLRKGFLEFRVDHRFGDFVGSRGGWETFYGLESASDIRIAFEYGVTDRLMVGLGRTKGDGPVKRLIEGLAKYQISKQTEDSWVPTIAVTGNAVMSTMKKSLNPNSISAFPEWYHRLSFMGQLNITRAFGKRFSLAAIPTYLHRNYVRYDDVNDQLFLGLGGRFEFASGWAILSDCFLPLTNRPDYENPYFVPIGVALEYETGGGHIFQINFMNNEGIVANDFLPYTDTDWLDGQFRFGFHIVRKFVL